MTCKVSPMMKCIIFADDTNFLYTGDDIAEICKTVSTQLDKLSTWLNANKLSLNVSKTNFMVLSRKKINNTLIVSINERVYITRFLGVLIGHQLDWTDHIKRITNKIAKNVSVMNRVKQLLNSDALYSLYCTLIMPYLNYCCEAWGNTYKSRIHPLHMLQQRLCESVNMKGSCHTQDQSFSTLKLCVCMI